MDWNSTLYYQSLDTTLRPHFVVYWIVYFYYESMFIYDNDELQMSHYVIPLGR